MLWTPKGHAFGWSFSSTGTTRVAAAWGTSVTPGNNTMGSYAQVLTSGNISKDVFGIQIQFNSNAVSAAARDTICDIGIDAAGGTSYTVLIPSLLASCAAPSIGATGGGLNYYFPLYIKAGSTLAVRASVNNATVGTLRCGVRVFGAPKDRRNIVVGSKVVAYGITAGSSTGTAVTPGTTSDGTWTSLGTIASGDNCWYWQYGVGINQSTITAVAYSGDLGIGDASNKVIVGEDRVWQGTTTEQWYDNGFALGYYQAKGGDIVYGRLQCSGTAVSGISMAAYGVK
jgi:hypothetical protein